MGVVIVLLLAAGTGTAIRLHRHPQVRTIVGDEVPAGPGSTVTVLRPDQTEVTGEADVVTATGAQLPPLATPLVITVPNRGTGGLRMSGALVNGRRSTIEWNAGQPLPLNGAGGLDLSPVRLDASATGLRWHLDGAPRTLTPGRYSFGSSVAVGAAGLATPVDRVDFTADGQTAFTTTGDAGVTQAPRPVDVTGPGTLRLTGTLQVRTAAGTRSAATASFGEGPYELHLTPDGSRWRVDLLTQGPPTG